MLSSSSPPLPSPRRTRGLVPSSMPFAYPHRNYPVAFETEALRRVAREARAAEESRAAYESQLAERILFYKSQGMSLATLHSKFGKEIVSRVLDAERK